MRKIFKNDVTVNDFAEALNSWSNGLIRKIIAMALEGKNEKAGYCLGWYHIKVGKITDNGNGTKLYSVNYTNDFSGKRTRVNEVYFENKPEYIVDDIISRIAYYMYYDRHYVSSVNFGDENVEFNESEGIVYLNLDEDRWEWINRLMADLFTEEYRKFKLGAMDRKAERANENNKIYAQWCEETNTYMWREAQDAIYTMEPEDFKKMLYEHQQPLPVEERLISPVEESEIQNQDTDEVEVEDTPMLDGADEILDAIVAGDFKAGRMIADDGKVLTVTLDGNWLSDGTRKVKLAKRSTEYVARILEDFCKDEPVETYKEYMEELVTDSPEVVIGILADTMGDFDGMVADTENYGTGADFNMDWYRAYCDTVEWFYDDCDVRTVVVDRTELENDGCFEEAYPSELFEEKMNVAFDKYLTHKRKVIMNEEKVRANIEGMFEEDGYLETPGGYSLDFEGGAVTLTEPNGEFVEVCDLDEDDDTEVSMKKIIDVLKKKGILDDFADVEEEPAVTDDVSADMWMALKAGKKNWSFSQNGIDYSYDAVKGKIYASKGTADVTAKLEDEDADSLNDTLVRLTDKVICVAEKAEDYGSPEVWSEIYDLALSLSNGDELTPGEGKLYAPLEKDGVNFKIFDNYAGFSGGFDNDGDLEVRLENNEGNYCDVRYIEDEASIDETFDVFCDMMLDYSDEAYANYADDKIVDQIVGRIKDAQYPVLTLYRDGDIDWNLAAIMHYVDEIAELADVEGLEYSTENYRDYTFEWAEK